MSLYNMINGVNKCTFFIAPLIFGHPQNNIARFRDCFIKDGNIIIYTRLGGGNREDYMDDIAKLQSHELYIEDYDDDFDCTYASFVFKIPKEFANDINKIKSGKIKKTTKKYKNIIIKTFPIIEEQLKQILY